MGERPARTTRRFDNGKLVALTKQPDEIHVADSDDDPFAEWDDSVAIPAGSQPEALPTASRTATVCDPLTTGVLAEIARRTATIEIDPDAVKDGDRRASLRTTREIEASVLQAALRKTK